MGSGLGASSEGVEVGGDSVESIGGGRGVAVLAGVGMSVNGFGKRVQASVVRSKIVSAMSLFVMGQAIEEK